MPEPPEPLLPIVRDKVKELLLRSQSFRALPEATRKELAHGMVQVASYIVGGDRGDNAPAVALVGNALAEAPPRPPTASGDMKASGAAAATSGGAALADLVARVDFPKFVSGLVDGVFNAIVDASIKQMEAYAELVKNVAKSVDEFMKDNVSENQARDYLADKYPDQLEVDVASGQPRVKKKPSADDAAMPDFFADLGLPTQGAVEVDDEVIEQQLVPAARKRLAMDRQQMLATMVMMGINRIVVTDGSIKASVVFDLTTRDAVQRSHSQTATSQDKTKTKYRPSFFGWFAGYRTVSDTEFSVTTVTSDKDDSQATVDMKAKLAGEVNIRFRSETFPLEKMTELLAPDVREKVQGKLPQRPSAVGAAPPLPAVAAPTLPPLPSLPTPAR